MDALIDQVRNRHKRAIAQLMTRVENDSTLARYAIRALYGETGQAHILGITGPPGSGKSTLVNEIAKELRCQEFTVGIIAVDPSSPFSGGALLGDRVRMRDLAGDDGVFIRSMASRGSLGGLARTTSDLVKILDAAGFDLVLIETVGAGQAEVDIAGAAHTTLVVEAPGMGDEIQTIKAGILEIADILVVNKADRPGSDRTVKALKVMLQMGIELDRTIHHGQMMQVESGETKSPGYTKTWKVPVIDTVATEGKKVKDLVKSIISHKQYLLQSGNWFEREKARSLQELDQLLRMEIVARLQTLVSVEEREKLIEAVASRQIDPYSAVDQLISKVEEVENKRG